MLDFYIQFQNLLQNQIKQVISILPTSLGKLTIILPALPIFVLAFNLYNFICNSYAKLRVNLKLEIPDHLPTDCKIINESDNISAGDINLSIAIIDPRKFWFDRSKYFTYLKVNFNSLKPKEEFNFKKVVIEEWHKNRDFKYQISELPNNWDFSSDIYNLTLKITYKPNKIWAVKNGTITKKYKLRGKERSNALVDEDRFYWKLE